MPLRPPDLTVQPDPINAAAQADLRLAELVASFSLVCDLTMGHPSDEAMRACLLATAFARRTGRGEAEVADIYWTTLLAHAGCTAFAHEQAALFAGDEIAINAAGSKTDFHEPREAFAFLAEVGRGRAALDRARIVVGGIVAGKRFDSELATANCEIAATVARRLELAPTVERALLDMFERWDGKGAPHARRGEEIALAARFAQLAHQAVIFARLGGEDAVVAMAQRRAGKALDPELAHAFARDAAGLLATLDSLEPVAAVLAAEPSPQLRIPPGRLADVARVFAEIVDLKSPLLMGHSTGVAELAEAAAREFGMSAEQAAMLKIAGLLHDLGRTAVPNGVWEKPGALTQAEWEQVRLHAYHTERILLRSPALAPLAPTAGMHHERLDGSGYHRGITAQAIPSAVRVLAAADAFQAMTEARRHRPALGTDAAATQLVMAVDAGRLDALAVDAVLTTAGARRRAGRPALPGNLTEREVDVLRLAARGLSNREIGRRLFIAPKTVGRHIEHIYGKLDIRSRAAAALFAAANGLVD
jgi:HD-GYP domain-containing protein (c-di-GMP phosphodiesterase class II)/DNA-binding CsgD family transcriptional regulator